MAVEPITEDENREADNPGKKEREASPAKKLPRFALIQFAVFGVSLIFFAVCCFSRDFADFFCRYIASGPRAVMAWLTAWIPFSFAEFLIIIMIPAAVIIIRYGIKHYADSWRNLGVFCLIILSFISSLFTSYVFSLGAGYRGSSLDEKLGLERHDLSAEELRETTVTVIEKVNREAKNIVYGSDGFSVMPYDTSEMTKRILDAYEDACGDYRFIQKMRTPLKLVMLSEPWTYTHITGVYSYFTGESNININMPDYTIPYTGAHELAHQRGIAREDEANFVAYLVGIRSDDAYIRYSTELNMLEYLLNAYYSADSEHYAEVYFMIDENVRKEMSAYSKFFSKYRRTVVSQVSEAVNDTYLKINGTPGSRSYGMVVDLCAAYYAAEKED